MLNVRLPGERLLLRAAPTLLLVALVLLTCPRGRRRERSVNASWSMATAQGHHQSAISSHMSALSNRIPDLDDMMPAWVHGPSVRVERRPVPIRNLQSSIRNQLGPVIAALNAARSAASTSPSKS